MNLEEIAAELYRLTPGEFTAARNARAKAVAAEGDKVLAAEIRALPKPSASAWAINRLAAAHGEVRAELAELGATLRGEGEHPDRQRLGELNDQRRALVSDAAALAAEDARQSGAPLSPAALAEVQQTLFAAIADPRAAAAAFSTRLVRPLQTLGLDEVDLDGAVAGALPDDVNGGVAGESHGADGLLTSAGRAGEAAGREARPGRGARAETPAAKVRAQASAAEAQAQAAAAAEAAEAAEAVHAALASAVAAREQLTNTERALERHRAEAADVADQIDEAHAALIRLEHRGAELAARGRDLERDRDAARAVLRRAESAASAAEQAAGA